MSADIVRSVTAGGRVTRQDLYDLLAQSQLKDVGISTLSGTAAKRLITPASLPPAGMVDGQLWWDMSEQLMRCFDADVSYAFAVGPDRFEGPAYAACPIVKGAAIRVDGALCYSEYGNHVGVPWVQPIGDSMDAAHCFGLAAESAASGACFPIAWFGIAQAFFGYSLYSAATINIPVAVGSGVTGLVGSMSTLEATATYTWAIGNLLELPRASHQSCHSMLMYIQFTGPHRIRNLP